MPATRPGSQGLTSCIETPMDTAKQTAHSGDFSRKPFNPRISCLTGLNLVHDTIVASEVV